jgi:hypothetical protein
VDDLGTDRKGYNIRMDLREMVRRCGLDASDLG